MEWTEEIEHQIQYLGNCARGYVWMYRRDIQKFSRINTWLKGTGISLGVIAGCLGVLAATLQVEETRAIIGISAILSFGTSFCQGYINQLGYDDKISDLKRQISKYSGLINNIKRQLGLPREKREIVLDYHRWITQNYDGLTETAIDATIDTVDEYRELCRTSGLPFPDDTTKDGNIVIHISGGDTSPRQNPEGSKVDLAQTITKDEHDIVLRGTRNGNRNGTLHGQATLQEALQYTDGHMKYELSRLQGHE